jgi:hypothetical protein
MGANQPSETTLDRPLRVTNTNAGQLKDGDLFESGTELEELLRSMLIQPAQGTVSLSGTSPQTREMGDTFSPTLTADPTQNQSGPVDEVRIDGTIVSPSPYELTPTFQIGAAADVQASRSFQAACDFEASDDFSALTATSGQVVYRGKRYIFYGTSNAAPASSADVRGLGSSILDAQDGKVFSIDVPSGATSVEFAYPKALGTVQKIEFQGALTSDVTADYNRSTVSVNGGAGDGSYAIDYYVYRREPQDSYSDVTVEVTI